MRIRILYFAVLLPTTYSILTNPKLYFQLQRLKTIKQMSVLQRLGYGEIEFFDTPVNGYKNSTLFYKPYNPNQRLLFKL